MSGRDSPGRVCPLSYRYSPRVFDVMPQIEAATLYVIGGLYGNVEALEALREIIGRERGAVAVVFNGDFHWFDVDAGDFAMVDREVARHAALRGNVETEISMASSGAGCGCAYPGDVGDAEVERSNRILQRLRRTAMANPTIRARLRELPMHLCARVGDARIGPAPTRETILGLHAHGVHIDAVPVRYEHERWIERFRAAWPEGSPAHTSYFGRLRHGPSLPFGRLRPVRAA